MSDPALSYADPDGPGITRRRAGRGWAYSDPNGARITDRTEIDRLNAIALPPAYRRCWFCPIPEGHILAIGYDHRGRRQYRYHPQFRATQEAEKYAGCADFGRALPALRQRVEADLARPGIDRRTAIAAIVRLLDLGHVRVGNDVYVKANGSYGATTLRNRHARVKGTTLHLSYRGKSGRMQDLAIADRRLAIVVRRCQDLPGQRLFQYVDKQGARYPITSTDVNDYIRVSTGSEFTARHFRTWGASVIAYRTIVEAGAEGIDITRMLAPVADALGNTPAISRKSYVHPMLVEWAKAGGLKNQTSYSLPRATRWLSAAERGLIALLDEAPADSSKKAA